MEGGLGSQRYGKIIFLVLTVFSVWSAAQSSKCRGNVCYIEDSSFTDFQSARQRCQSFGGDVVMVDTLEERRLLTEICLRSNYTAPYLLMGATYNSEQWVWFTGEAVSPSVMSWAVGQPEDPSTQPFLCIDSTTGLWHDCASDLEGVLCETKRSSLCLGLGCCSGQNNSCNVNLPILGGCYCDEHCLRANDCCEDYVDTCVVIDECFAYTTVTGEISRSSMYHKNSVEAVACDDKIDHGWFRFDMITGNDMPETCHFEGDCGTDNPIWLNGSLPFAADGVINRTACVKNSTVCCAKTYDIQIKNCSTYNVYHLPPVTQCPERYCIGDKALCPPGTVSENGFEPGCSDNFPNITQQPDIQVDERVVRYTFGNIPKKELMFTCLPYYDEVPAERLSQLVFDVEWYIDSQLVHEEDSVNVTDLPAQLRESVWLSKSITLGFQVKCRVKGKYVQDGQQVGARSLAVESPEFFAGIKVLNSSDFPIRMKENDPNPAIIAFQPTVPILCTDSPSHGLFCEDIFLQVEVRIPQQWKQALCPSEGGVSQIQQVVVEACGIEINAKYWNKTVTLKIAPVIDGIYDGNQITKVLLSTAEFNDHQAWSNYRLPDIPVLVVDADIALQGHVCMANSDPHMVTFDGVGYECQLPGEFILYKHQTLPIQVHGFFKTCNRGWAFCPCAVTVMSGGDLFIFDRCRSGTGSETTKGIKKPMRSGLLGCEHGQMRVESFNNAKDYKIYLPTGGYVYARSYYYIDDYYMNIHVHPGSRDVESTVGLCGTLNGIKNDDFLRPDGTVDSISRHPNEFSLSWRVSNASDSMYNGIPASANVASIQGEYCRCPNVGDQIVFNSTVPVDCSYTENVAKCASDNSYSEKQLAKCRRRRAAAGHDEIFEIRKFEYNPDDRLGAPTWQNGWSEVKAEAFCSNYIYNSSAGKACQAVESVDYEVALRGCKDDIHLTGGTAWALAALDPIKGMCVGELAKNESYWVVDNSTGEVALPAELDVIKCPNDCSYNGECINNNGTSSCECYPGFVSSDCSISRDTIPDLFYMPTNGLCDISQRPCLETPVYGGPFVQSSNLSCKTEHFTASGVITEYNEAEFVHEEEVICPFPKFRQKRSDISSEEVIKIYNISISNDGTNYSQPLKVAVYDSKCYKCDGPSQCQLKNGTCSINGKCFNKEEQNPSDACQICNPNVTTSDWYLRPSTCTIDNQCYTDGRERTGSFCHVCSSDKNRNSWDIKNGTCRIEEMCYKENDTNPDDPCQICIPSWNKTAWYTQNRACRINGTCYHEGDAQEGKSCKVCNPAVNITDWVLLNETCFVNHTCYNNSDRNPTEPCQLCDPKYSTEAWFELNGTCSINGSCYNETQRNPARPCQICDPGVSETNWTELSGHCEIEGSCIKSQESRRGHGCHICSSSTSKTSWTIKNGTCSINGSCYNETQQNPARPCQICDPVVSITQWTDLNETCELDGKCLGNLESRDGHVCHICSPSTSRTSWTIKNGTCSINGSCYNETQQNPARPCQICDPSKSQTLWTILNGTCRINGSCYNETQQNPARPCQICDPGVSNTQWTDLSESCEIEGICIGNLESKRGHVCHVCSSSSSRTAWTIKNGTCRINGSCYNETQQNPARPCQICDTRVSNTQWTDLNENCEIEGICNGNLESRRGHVCHVCSSSNSRTAWTIKNGTCRINGSCYNETQQNPARPCQICDPNVSNTEWTDLNETCELDGKCLGNLESRDGHVCHICSPSTSRTSWTIKNGTCSINGSCYNETQQNPEKPCQICDPSISQTVWTILNNTCLIDGVCYSTCQVNPVDNTTVCFANTTAYNWTSAEACDQMVDTGSTVKAESDANMAVVLGGVLGSISFIAVTLIVVAAIIHILHWKSKQKERKNQYLESNLAPRLSKTSHLGYVCAQNTDVLRGDRYIGNPTAIGRDNQGYQSSTERYDRGSKYLQNNRHQPAYKIGRQIYIPPPDY